MTYLSKTLAGLLAALTVPLVLANPVIPIRWVEVKSDLELQKVCLGVVNRKAMTDGAPQWTSLPFKVSGCFETQGGICNVYTLPPLLPYDNSVHVTLGHEVRHCFKGLFHP